MISNINKRGFGTYEVLTVSVMCLIIMVVILSVTFKSNDHEKYKVMISNARTFGSSINSFDEGFSKSHEYSLRELVDKGMISKLKNPFVGDKYCDMYESRIAIVNDKKYVTLRCGEYIIFNQYIGDHEFKVYKISAWSNEQHSAKDISKIGYNYTVNGKKIYDEYYSENSFIYMYNLTNNTKYKTISEMNDVGLDKKILYATLKLVK